MLGKLLKQLNLATKRTASEVAIHFSPQSMCLVSTTPNGSFKAKTEAINSHFEPEALTRLVSSVKKGSCVHLVLSPEYYQLVQLDKPALADPEILQALPWQVKDLVSIAPEDMVADYTDVPGTAAQAAKINVVVASISVLKPLVSTIVQAGLKLMSIQPEEWLAAYLQPPQAHAAMLVIQQPEQEVLIQIVKDGVLYFSRRTRGFNRMQFDTDIQLQNDWLDRLQLELQRSMDYFEGQLKQAPVREIGLLMPNAQQLSQLLSNAGFSRVSTLTPAITQNGCSESELLHCWPAIAVLNQPARDNAA